MANTNPKPILFLAFANDRQASGVYLRNLGHEAETLRDALTPAEQAGLCQVEILASASAESILKRFHDPAHRGRIALFHYAGHAEDYDLLLESATGQAVIADGRGLALFLRQQSGLHLVFLNACSTRAQVEGLLDAGVAAVIATSRAVDDQVATDFAYHFYKALASGVSIRTAFGEAHGSLQFVSTGSDRHLRPVANPNDEHAAAGWPWKLYLRAGAEDRGDWNLPSAANDPLYGLPPLPAMDLPAKPFRDLSWFRRADAPIFFGRGQQIRQLYTKVTDANAMPVVLFYGQSGVGKSSLLDAGLLPRLEQVQRVVYLRRDQEKGLLGTLVNNMAGMLALEGSDSAASKDSSHVLDAWHAVEQQAGKPLTLILDQVEEHFTRPNPALPDEMAQFLAALTAIFADRSQRPQGKLILSFRKEWLAEIEKRLIECEVTLSKVFLERLDEAGVIEAVRGVAHTPALQQHYGLTIDDGLAEAIAHDLLQDREAPVAPMLQILLTRLWEEVTQRNRANPRFDQVLYDRLRRGGLNLKEFLDRQLTRLQAQQPEVVDSGLALDLLTFHTTPLGTAEQRDFAALQTEYRHRSAILTELVRSFQNLYLLVDPAADQADAGQTSRLAHDTLAPLVRARFNESELPGQRARRILESRAIDWKQRSDSNPLDEADLSLVVGGMEGMRAVTKYELRLVRASVDLHKQREAERQEARKREQAHQRKLEDTIKRLQEARALTQAHQRQLEHTIARLNKELAISEAQRLSVEARSVLATAPETAVLLACEATSYDHNFYSEQILRDALDQTLMRVTPLIGHTEQVNSALFSRNGQQILTASADGAVRLWDTTGASLLTFGGHTNRAICRAIFSPDERQILTTSVGGAAQLWSRQGELFATFTPPALSKGKEEYWTKGSFSPDGRKILVSSGEEVWLWDVNSQHLQLHLHPKERTFLQKEDIGHTQWIKSARFSPNGEQILTASLDGSVRLWDSAGRQCKILRWEGKEVFNAIFHPTNHQLILVGLLYSAELWDIEGEGKLLTTLGGHIHGVNLLAFSADGQSMLTVVGAGYLDGHAARLWDRAGELLGTLGDHLNPISSIAISPDSQSFLTVSAGTVHMWNRKGEKIALLHGHLADVTSATFSPDERYILTASQDKTARLWEYVGTPLPKLTDPGYKIDDARYIDNGQHILTSSGFNSYSYDGFLTGSQVTLWNRTGDRVAVYPGFAGMPFPMRDLEKNALSIDGRSLLTVQEKFQVKQRPNSLAAEEERFTLVCLWQLPTGLAKVPTSDQVTPVLSLRFSDHSCRAYLSPDAQRILTSTDEAVQLWDNTGALKATLAVPNLSEKHPLSIGHVLFSPDNQRILTTAGGDSVYLWDLNGQYIGTIFAEGITHYVRGDSNDTLFDITFSPDGSRILSTVRHYADLWDRNGQHLQRLECNMSYKIRRGLFSPDGERIITIGEGAGPTERYKSMLYLWDGEGELIESFEHNSHFRGGFDDAGQRFCGFIKHDRVGVWDRDGKLLATLPILEGIQECSLHGDQVIVVLHNGATEVWSITNKCKLTILRSQADKGVRKVQVSPDGASVLMLLTDGTVQQHLLKVDDLLEIARNRVGRSFTPDEITRFNLKEPLRFDLGRK